MNNLICYMENGIKKWDMVKEADRNAFLLNIMNNKNVDLPSIFIIPTSSILGGIWLFSDTHKSNRVDFWNFFEDFGTPYIRPEVTDEKEKETLREIKEKRESKYGYVSPDGRYFHCDYQGHSALAGNICYGLIDTDNPERYLEEHGWLKIYNPLTDRRYAVYTGEKITDAQMKTLIKMGLDNAEHVSEMLRGRR